MRNVAALDIAGVAQPVAESLHEMRRVIRRGVAEKPDHRHGALRLLRRGRAGAQERAAGSARTSRRLIR